MNEVGELYALLEEAAVITAAPPYCRCLLLLRGVVFHNAVCKVLMAYLRIMVTSSSSSNNNSQGSFLSWVNKAGELQALAASAVGAVAAACCGDVLFSCVLCFATLCGMFTWPTCLCECCSRRKAHDCFFHICCSLLL